MVGKYNKVMPVMTLVCCSERAFDASRQISTVTQRLSLIPEERIAKQSKYKYNLAWNYFYDRHILTLTRQDMHVTHVKHFL
jgi:hypothetical protein